MLSLCYNIIKISSDFGAGNNDKWNTSNNVPSNNYNKIHDVPSISEVASTMQNKSKRKDL